MKKLQNILYLTLDDAYLSKDGKNVVIIKDSKVLKRFPIHILDGIMCFNYTGVSPALMKFAMENNLLISFFTPEGRFCGRVIGKTNGNVLLRRRQYQLADSDDSLEFVQNIIYAKIFNSRKVLKRAIRDHKEKIDSEKLLSTIDFIDLALKNIRKPDNKDSLRAIEGNVASRYFACFDEMIVSQRDEFYFIDRNRRPPEDNTNALLSFMYSLLTYEMQSALEGVGIDSYVGFFHVDRPGRSSMALDMIEELRAYMCDRLALTMINKNIITAKDFEKKETGAVLLNDKGRAKVLENWQKRKQDEIKHPFINEKIKIGLIPHVQAMLLNRYIRGDLEAYPPFLMKG